MKPLDTRALEHALDLLRLAITPSTRELVSIGDLLREAHALVEAEARARSLAVVVVGVPDRVFVPRRDVVLVVAALLERAIRSASANARVAITAQDFDDELVFAVYVQGEARRARLPQGDFVCEAASLLGGRAWTAPLEHANLTLFSVPLYAHVN